MSALWELICRAVVTDLKFDRPQLHKHSLVIAFSRAFCLPSSFDSPRIAGSPSDCRIVVCNLFSAMNL
eukprot:1178154-Amphidinium_carterae.1